MESITKEDLMEFRKLLLDDIQKLMANQSPEETPDEEFGWLRSKSIRKKMNISPGTLQNLRITGKIRFKKVLGSYYYNYADLKKIFDEEKK